MRRLVPAAARVRRLGWRGRIVESRADLGRRRRPANGVKFRIRSERVPGWYTARRLNESVYGFKTLVEEHTDRILGAHIVGPHAEGVINLFGVAIRYGLTTTDLKTTIFAYPTGASDIGYML